MLVHMCGHIITANVKNEAGKYSRQLTNDQSLVGIQALYLVPYKGNESQSGLVFDYVLTSEIIKGV